MKNQNWTGILQGNSTSTIDEFVEITRKAAELNCPVKTVKTKSTNINPWFTSGLFKSRKHKLKLLVKARGAKTAESKANYWKKYKEYRNLYAKLIQRAKENFFNQQLLKNKLNPKKTWSLARQALGQENTQNTTKIGNISGHTNNKDRAEALNKFYSKIASDLVDNLPQSKFNHKHFLKEREIDNPYKVPETTEYEVYTIISKMENKTSHGVDNWSNKMLKHVKEIIALPLSHCINLSLKLNYIPQIWKTARIIPLFKGGDKECPGQYRPIALLPTMTKVLEKVVVNQITQHLTDNELFCPQQFGFRKKHSTEHLITTYLHKLFEAKNEKKMSLSIYLDIKKAFDCLSHTILFDKLKNLGICTSWIKAYLSNRTQFTTINGQVSSNTNIKHGVPQGSCIGPLLFLCYIMDLPESTNLSTFLFADDTTVVCSANNCADLYNIANKELQTISNWFRANKLTLNGKKTRFMEHFTKGKMPHNMCLKLNDNVVQRVHDKGTEKEFKLVGIFLDENLSWKSHVHYVQKKIYQIMALLSRAKKCLPQSTKQMIFRCLIQTRINYGIIAYGGAKKNILKPLIKTQKRALRLVTGSKYNCHTAKLWQKVNCLNITAAHQLVCINFAKQWLTNTIPQGLSNLVTQKQSVVGLRDSTKTKLITPVLGDKSTESFPSYQIPQIYNKTSSIIKESPYSATKFEIKTMFFSTMSNEECNEKNCFSCSQNCTY